MEVACGYPGLAGYVPEGVVGGCDDDAGLGVAVDVGGDGEPGQVFLASALDNRENGLGPSFAGRGIGGQDLVAGFEVVDGFGGAVGGLDRRVAFGAVGGGGAGVLGADVLAAAVPGQVIAQAGGVRGAVEACQAGVRALCGYRGLLGAGEGEQQTAQAAPREAGEEITGGMLAAIRVPADVVRYPARDAQDQELPLQARGVGVVDRVAARVLVQVISRSGGA